VLGPRNGGEMIASLAFLTQLTAACAPQVAPGTLAALADIESRFNTLAINDNTTHKVLWPKRPAEAIAWARQAIAAGHSIDLGLMQINSGNLASLHLSIPEAFDPCMNLRAGAVLLASDYAGGKTPSEQQAALRTALLRYNTGTAQGSAAQGYVARVLNAAKRVVPEIDPGATELPQQPPAMTPKDWNVFPNSPGPGRLKQQFAEHGSNLQPRAASKGSPPTASSTVTVTGRRTSAADMATEGSDE